MTYEEAARILDPETSREALLPYAYDPQYQQMLLRDACQIAAEVLRGFTDTNAGDKWVSVKDELPSTDGEYLVASADAGARFVETSFYFANGKRWHCLMTLLLIGWNSQGRQKSRDNHD